MRRAAWLLLLLVGCSGSSSTEPPPLRVDLIDSALDAVDEVLGADVAYFEVNATSQVVNVFVARNGNSVVQFIYDGTSLVGPTTPVDATGTMFERGLIDVDADVLEIGRAHV